MTKNTTITPIAAILKNNQKDILDNWIKNQIADADRSEGISDEVIKNNSNQFFKLFIEATKNGNLEDVDSKEWEAVKTMLSELSASRAVQGSSPTETANLIFALKKPIFVALNADIGDSSPDLAKATWEITILLDKLGMYTTEVYQRSREAIIRRQQKDMLEMSTPVIKIWEGILAVPLIGTLDSSRTQIVMEALLQAIVETGAKITILDITGVPTVDTQTAQHLIKTVSAARLMGADCIISGIRPQIAQTIVHLGIDIYDITTKATMADAIDEALSRNGWTVSKELKAAKDR